MANDNSFIVKLQAMLDRVKSIANIKRDIKAIEAKLPKIKMQGTLNSAATKKELNTKLKTVKPKVKVDADTTAAEKKIKKLGQQKTKTTVQSTVDNSKVVSELKTAQKETKTLWDRLANEAVKSNLVRISVQKVTEAIGQAIAAVKELDTIKTNIQMVSGTSDFDANALMSSYNVMAKELSSTTKDVAEAANEFLRMGESIETANELIKSSQILSKVGMIDSADAASYLISSLKGFQVEAEDSIDIVSKLTSVDLEAAVSAGGLAEAISKCSNIANNSGTSMDRLIGYTAAVGEVTQESMSVIGNAFKSIYSRMNNIKIGRLIDDESGESLSDTESVLSDLGIQLRDTADTYKNFDDILNDIGTRWKDFTQVEQNAISVAMAGTMQRNRFLALMNNWTKALEYSEVAANSAGSALERYGVYQDSIEAKTNELTAAIESLSTSTISEGLYSGIIEATTGIVEFLDKTNLLKASLAGFIAMRVSKAIASIGAGFITAAKSTAQLSAAMTLFGKGIGEDNLKEIGALCKGLNNNQLKLILSTKGLKTQQRLTILEGMKLNKQEREQMLTTLGFAAAEDKTTASTFSLKGAFRSLGTVIATNPIGVIVTAVSIATMVFSGFNRAMEEAKQKAKELGDSFKSIKLDIDSYKSKIEELHTTINDDSSSLSEVTEARKNLMTIQDELIEKFGSEKETIESITQAVNGQGDAFDRLAEKQWIETKNKFNEEGFWLGISNWSQGYDTNVERMIDEMENAREILSFSYDDFNSGEFEILIQRMEKLGWTYQDSLHGFVKTGNLKGIYADILEIQGLVKGMGAPDIFQKSLTKEVNKVKETIDSYSSIWDAYILHDMILESEELAQIWINANEAYTEYKKAFEAGDEEARSNAVGNYSELLNDILYNSNVTDSVKKYFKDMYPVLTNEAEKWEFRFKVLPEYDTHSLNGKTQTDILEMLQTDGIQYGEGTFDSLLRLASDYGIVIGNDSEKIKQLLDLLVEWKFLQEEIVLPETTIETQNLSEQLTKSAESLDKFQSSMKSASEAYTKLLSGGYSSNDLLDSLQAINQAVTDMGASIEWESISSMEELGEAIQDVSEIYLNSFLKDNNISPDSKFAKMLANAADEMYRVQAAYNSFNDSIDTIQSAYDKLSTAVSEYNTNGYVTLDTLQSVLSINDEYISCLTDENGKLVLNEEMYEKLTMAKLDDAKNTIIQEGIQQLENIALSNSVIASQKAGEAADIHAKKLHNSVDRIRKHTKAMMDDSVAVSANNEVLSGGTIDDLESAYQKALAVNEKAAEDVMSSINTKLSFVDSVASNTFSSFGKVSGASSAAAKETKESAKETAESFNWIETAISHIQRTIKNLGSTVSSAWKSWTTRNAALASELSEVRKEIELQNSAYAGYMSKADSVGLSGHYKELVQNGALSIEDITDDTLKEQIKEYKEYYEKAIDCKDAVTELKDKLAELAKLKFDHISTQYDAKIQDIDHMVNLINGELEKAEESNKIAGKSFYEALIEQENAKIDSLTNEYKEKLAAMNEAVSSGTIREGSEAWQEMKSDIDSVTESIQEANTQVLTYENSIKEIAKLKFDSLGTQFDNALSIITTEMSQLDKQIALVEEAGYLAGESFYHALIEGEKSHMEALMKKYESLSSSLKEALDSGSVTKFDETWYDMTGGIRDVEDALLDAQTALVKYSNSLRELEWDVFDRMQESITGLTEESDFMIDFMGRNNTLHNENGSFNDRGLSAQGLHAVNYDVYMRQAEEYANAIKDINGELANDPNNTKLQDRYQELIKLQREAILNAEDEKTAIKDLISEGYDKMLSFFDKMISARKKALSEEKNLHDYEKTISEQTAEVAKYQKILDAYKGDDSEGMKAVIQKAQESLAKAQEELSETEYDKYMSDQEALLDTFRTELEEWVNIRLDDINGLLQQAIEATNVNAQRIQTQINTDLSAVGMTLTENFARIFEIDYSGGVRDMVSGFFGSDGNFSAAMTTVNTAISEVRDKSDEIKRSTDQVSSILNQRFPELAQSMPNLTETNNRIGDVVTAVNLVKEAVASIRTDIAQLELDVPDYGSGDDDDEGNDDIIHNVTTTVTYTPPAQQPAPTVPNNNTGTKKPAQSPSKGSSGGGKLWEQNMSLKFYKKGVRNLPNGEVAITQEDGTEMILSPLRGGMLTPLCKGDSVMTAEETDNLYKIAQMPAEELKKQLYKNYPPEVNIKNMMKHPSTPVTNNNTVTSNNKYDVTFNLPNVRTTDELYNAMGTEMRFRRLIGGIANDSALHKLRPYGYKY